MIAPQALREAIDWHLALDGADDSQWQDFVIWLEADETHRNAYDHVSLDDSMLTRPIAVPKLLPLAVSRSRRSFGRPAAIGGALAAAAAVLFAILPVGEVSSRYTVDTGSAGRSVVLADGSRIQLNRATRLVLDRVDLRYASLERGEAMFHIRHDAAAPFRVDAGGTRLTDIGTAFNVIRDGERLDVAVAEGGVVARVDQAPAVTLRPGMMLSRHDAMTTTVGRVAIENVGGWKSGRLVYADAPLTDVAADLARASGLILQVDPALASRRFTGTLFLKGQPKDVAHSLAALAATRIRPIDGGWMLIGDPHTST